MVATRIPRAGGAAAARAPGGRPHPQHVPADHAERVRSLPGCRRAGGADAAQLPTGVQRRHFLPRRQGLRDLHLELAVGGGAAPLLSRLDAGLGRGRLDAVSQLAQRGVYQADRSLHRAEPVRGRTLRGAGRAGRAHCHQAQLRRLAGAAQRRRRRLRGVRRAPVRGKGRAHAARRPGARCGTCRSRSSATAR